MPKSPKSDEFFTFDEVLKELKLSEEELKRMVSEGEIRAFKDEDRMKFKKLDIETKRTEHSTEPTVILPPGDVEILASSNEATFIEEDTTSSIGATEEMEIGSNTDIHIPGLVEEAEVTTPVEPISPPDIGDTVAEEEISVAETIAEEGGAETTPEEALETVAETTKAPKPKGRITKFTQPSAAAPQPEAFYPEAAVAVTMAAPKFKTPIAFIVLLSTIVFFLVFIGSFLGDNLRISSGRGKYPVGITTEMGQMILDICGIKIDLTKFKKQE